MLAVTHLQPSAFRIIMNKGADLDAVDVDGWTALHFAVHVRSSIITKRIVRSDPLRCVNLLDSAGFSALFQAAQYGSFGPLVAMLKALGEAAGGHLMQHDADAFSLLHYAALGKSLSCTRRLAESFPALLYVKEKQWLCTPFMKAVGKDNVAACRLLRGSTEGGALDLLVSDTCQFGWSPLHEAVYHKSLDCARYIMEANPVSVLCLDEEGNTPLHIAAEKGHADAAQLLLLTQAGDEAIKVMLCAMDCNGDTALHLASNLASANVLLQALSQRDLLQSSLRATNNDGQTPQAKHADMHGMDPDTEVGMEHAAIVVALRQAFAPGNLAPPAPPPPMPQQSALDTQEMSDFLLAAPSSGTVERIVRERGMTAGAAVVLERHRQRMAHPVTRLKLCSKFAMQCKETAFGLSPGPNPRPGALSGWGEDAFFVNDSADAAGVADGVGSLWPAFGKDGGESARFMMRGVNEKLTTGVELLDALHETYDSMMAYPDVGACTLATYQLRGDTLNICTAGDSCVLVIRPSRMRGNTPPVHGGFQNMYVAKSVCTADLNGAPSQLGFWYSRNAAGVVIGQPIDQTPTNLWGEVGGADDDNATQPVHLREGDVIIATTDGMLDCLSTDRGVPSYEKSFAAYSTVVNTVLYCVSRLARAPPPPDVVREDVLAERIAQSLLAQAKLPTKRQSDAAVNVRTVPEGYLYPECRKHGDPAGLAHWKLWSSRFAAAQCSTCVELQTKCGSRKPDDLTVVVSVVARHVTAGATPSPGRPAV
jgi:ankyrin repeat protein